MQRNIIFAKYVLHIKYLIMKIKYLFLISLFGFILWGCEDDEPNNSLELSESSFNDISSNGATLEVDVTSNSDWTVTNKTTWCIIKPESGSGNQKLSIKVDANLAQTERSATISIASRQGKIKKEINLRQKATNINAEDYHYNLPVIFHVLYKDKVDPLQYVSSKRLSDILDKVNKLFRDNSKSVDMNLSFMLATTDPNGKTLSNPGIEYIECSGNYPIDCETFMNDRKSKDGMGYVDYLWNPNEYINVMIYNFIKDPTSNSTILGISHLPFSTTGSTYMEGLSEIEQSHLELDNIDFPYCVSINSIYINSQSTTTSYSTADVNVTLAHELGHYLGLHHVFSEQDNGELENNCKDTDYCEDTPSYDKEAYDINYAWAMSPSSNIPEKDLFAYLVKRNDCNDIEFTSHNIMDYSVSYSDQFTKDQRKRIRHVLNYSPLIPGPKIGKSDTRSATEGVLDLPIRTIK